MYNPDYKEEQIGWWRSRGYMPHLEEPGTVQHVTFHLADSLPPNALLRIEQELESIPPDKRDVEKRRRLEAWLDAGHGACPLLQPEIADKMQETLLHFDGVRYMLFAWAVMPNHVHTLLQPTEGYSIGQIVKSWKSFSGRFINELANVTTTDSPRVWHREYWDRYIRDERHFHAVVNYIHQNPVKARLVHDAREWSWSSAHPGFAQERGDAAKGLLDNQTE